MSLLRTVRTVRHLRVSQVVNRLTRRWVRLGAAVARTGQGYSLLPRKPVLPLASRGATVTQDGFRFLGETRVFSGEDRWLPKGASRLWTYQLHYMQALHDLEPGRAWAWIRDWIASNPPRVQPGAASAVAPGWEPYVISLRVREWIEWLHATDRLRPEDCQSVADSLATQVSVLEALLEYHLGGNHLLENAVTLCWAGASLEGPRARTWFQRGWARLEKLLLEQVLSDGTHDERSPMYQALIAEGLLRLALVLDHTNHMTEAAAVRQRASAMVKSLAHLVHPDGEYSLMNDCVLGEAPRLDDFTTSRLVPEIAPPREGLWALPEAGYVGWRHTSGTYLILDAGPLGPAHQPGHGHADLLAFELSHGGQRVVTDTGVLSYEPGVQRAYARSTAAHSTVEIDGRSQSELWAAFRCARRARVIRAGIVPDSKGGGTLYGAYVDPWGHSHERQISVEAGGVLGTDVVKARGPHTATLRFHLAPGLEARIQGEVAELTREGEALGRLRLRGAGLDTTATPYHPHFGYEIVRTCLLARVRFQDRIEFRWSLDLT